MTKEIRYKLQGDGRDSWEICEYNEDNILISKYMVYEDPNEKPIPDVDVIGLLTKMKQDSPEEFEKLKQLLTK